MFPYLDYMFTCILNLSLVVCIYIYLFTNQVYLFALLVFLSRV